MNTLIAPAINLGILIVVMVVYLRDPVCQFIEARHRSVGDEIKRVREMLRNSQEKHDEFSAKLKSISVEITALREQAKQDAQATKLRILSESQKTCGSIVSDARSAAEGLYSDLRSRLFSDVGQQVLNRAEVLMRERLTGDDKARIRKEFSSQVGATK